VTDAYEKCQFNIAVEEIRNFTWHVFCDAYVEAVKDRLYRPEVHGQAQKTAAQATLHEVLMRILQMLSPVAPHLTEEIYQTMYADSKSAQSLQQLPWPKANDARVDERAEKRGDIAVELIGEVRREKAEKRMPLNALVKTLTVYAGDESAAEAINAAESDIVGALKVDKLKILPEDGEGREVVQFPTIHFVAEYQAALPK
jgi:valyl-tRNA synthetase